MAVQILQGKVISNDLIAKDTYLLRFQSEGINSFDFQPGQFVTITVSPNVRRSYSIASAPGKDYLELIAATTKGGPGSQFFLNTKVGDTFEFLFPLGVFFYRESDKPAYFFSTGTGEVPFLSMAEYALTQLKTQREIYMYSGFRFEEDIFGQDLLKLLDIQYKNFIFKINLTQPTENWTGPVGRITQYIDELKNTDIEAYICGSNQMVTDIRDRLIAKGVPATQIYHEMF